MNPHSPQHQRHISVQYDAYVRDLDRATVADPLNSFIALLLLAACAFTVTCRLFNRRYQ